MSFQYRCQAGHTLEHDRPAYHCPQPRCQALLIGVCGVCGADLEDGRCPLATVCDIAAHQKENTR